LGLIFLKIYFYKKRERLTHKLVKSFFKKIFFLGSKQTQIPSNIYIFLNL